MGGGERWAAGYYGMIEKWELAHSPFEKDARRYKLRLRGTEEETQKLIQLLAANCGRPFVTLSQDYNWAFYIYALSNADKERVAEILKKYSASGEVLESSTLIVDQEMPPMLEDVLEAAAKSLIQQKQEPQVEKAGPPLAAVSRAPESNRIEENGIPAPQVSEQAPRSKETVPEAQRSGARPLAPSKNAQRTQENLPQIEPLPRTPLNPRYIFSEFIVGPNNRFTHAAAQAVAENPGKIYNPLFIYGGVGLGKTHLMHAIGHSVVSKNARTKLLYVATEKFMAQVIEAIRSGSINALREQYQTLDLLLIDDIQFLSGSESTQEEFFHVFNALHEMGKQILITSDRQPKLLSTLEDRLRSRFEWGLITDLKPPNLETRVAILKKKCQAIQLQISEEMLLFIAERAKSNIRELEGILNKIHAHVNLTEEKVDLEFLKEMLGELIPVQGELSAAKPAGVQETQAASSQVESRLKKASAPFSESLTPPGPQGKTAPPEIKKADQKKPPEVSESISKEFFSLFSASSLAKPPAATAELPTGGKEPKATQKEALLPGSAQVESAKQESAQTSVAVPDTLSPSAPLSQPIPTLPQTPPGVSAGAPASSKEEFDPSLRPVEVVCFYPHSKENEFEVVKQKFQDIIKKHRLKIRLSRLVDLAYHFEKSVDYSFFSASCKSRHCSTALVLGLPPTPVLSEDDFASALNTCLENDKISLQFIPWSEFSKDYRYLNCALDLSLSVPLSGAPGPEGKKGQP